MLERERETRVTGAKITPVLGDSNPQTPHWTSSLPPYQINKHFLSSKKKEELSNFFLENNDNKWNKYLFDRYIIKGVTRREKRERGKRERDEEIFPERKRKNI